LGLNGLEESEI